MSIRKRLTKSVTFPNRLKGFYDDGRIPFQFLTMANEELVNDSNVSSLILDESNGWLTGNFMKWKSVLIGARISNGYDFSNADIAYAFAQNNNLPFKMHNLAWLRTDKVPKDYPVFDIPSRVAAFESHATTMLSRFPNVRWIDVWNEILDPTINGPEDLTGDPEDYIASDGDWPVFSISELASNHAYVRALLPADCEICFNDFRLVGREKGVAAIEVVQALNNAGATIDVIAEQAHINTAGNIFTPTAADLEAFILSAHAIGCKVAFSEFDISIENFGTVGASLQEQYDLALEYIEVLYTHREKISHIAFWGNSDSYTWLHERNGSNISTEYPLPWGATPDMERKPFYNAIFNYLRTQS